MIHGYEEASIFPVIDLYDSGMMNTYINAVQLEYNRGILEYNNFTREFGDLYSPNDALNKAYYDATKGRINAMMNKFDELGIDPTRNREARALIQREIRNLPYDQIARWKSDAENMRMYYRSMALLLANGKYNPDLNKYLSDLYGIPTIESYDPYSGVPFTAVSPFEAKSIKDITNDVYNAAKPFNKTPEQVYAEYGVKADPMMQYSGLSYQDLLNIAGLNLDAWLGDPNMQYYKDLTRKQIATQLGKDPSEIDDTTVKNALRDTIANSNLEYRQGLYWEPDKLALANLQYQRQVALAEYKLSLAKDLAAYKNILKQKNSQKPTIFLKAEQNPGRRIAFNPKEMNKAGIGILDKNITVTNNSVSYKQDDKTTVKFDQTSVKIPKGSTSLVATGEFSKYSKQVSEAKKKNKSIPEFTPKRIKMSKDRSFLVIGGLTYNKDTNTYWVKVKRDINKLNSEYDNQSPSLRSGWILVTPTVIPKEQKTDWDQNNNSEELLLD